MFKILALLLITTTATLCGDLVDHLKKIDSQTGNYSMENIDFIYTINLDQRPKKFALCKEQLNKYGIEPFRFSAVNGWELSLETINDIGIKCTPDLVCDKMGTSYLPNGDFQPFHNIMNEQGRTYFCHCMSRGAIGIVLSHLSVLKHAFDSDFERIWVTEDDIQVIKDPRILSSLIRRLNNCVGKDGWDILFTDRDTKNSNGDYVTCASYAWRPNFTPSNPGRFSKKVNISPDFTKIGARYGAYSMIINRSGIKKILDFIEQHGVFLPYDMEFYLPDDINLYAVRDDVVSTIPNAASDNGGPNYKQELLFKGASALTEYFPDLSPADETLKQKVFESMNQLEGWCSHEKASILIDLIRHLKPNTIVEIGVWGGKSLIPMAYALKANKKGHIYGIDPWSADASAEGMDGANLDWWAQVNHEKIYTDLLDHIARFRLQKKVSLVRATSEAAPLIHHIDMLHIDGNHSEEAAFIDVTKWVPQVRSGGLVIFDDVNWSTTSKAVEWLDERCIPLFQITGDNIWGVWQKL